MREAFRHGGFADTRLAGENGIVLAAAHENVHALPDFLVATDDGINFTFADFFREIGGEAFQRFLLAHLGRRDGATGFTRLRARTHAGAVAGVHDVFGRAGNNFREVIRELLRLDLGKLSRQSDETILDRISLEVRNDEMSGANLIFAVHERGINVSLLERGLDVRREVADGRGPARQTVQSGDEVCCEARRIKAEMLDDSQGIGVLLLEELVQPVDGFDVGVAAHLAEDGGGLDGFVADGIEFAEQCGAFDVSHIFCLLEC